MHMKIGDEEFAPTQLTKATTKLVDLTQGNVALYFHLSGHCQLQTGQHVLRDGIVVATPLAGFGPTPWEALCDWVDTHGHTIGASLVEGKRK